MYSWLALELMIFFEIKYQDFLLLMKKLLNFLFIVFTCQVFANRLLHVFYKKKCSCLQEIKNANCCDFETKVAIIFPGCFQSYGLFEFINPSVAMKLLKVYSLA